MSSSRPKNSEHKGGRFIEVHQTEITFRDDGSGADVALYLLPPSLRVIIVSNQLPLRIKRGPEGWEFEWDEDALVAQAKVGGGCACMGT